MAREKIVGFRVSDELYARLHEMALEKTTSISDVMRDIIIENLDMSYRYSQWEVHAWNLFNVNADQVAYAKRASKIPEQFFSIMSKWSKDTKIKVIAHTELVIVEFQYKGKMHLIQESKILPKIQIIQSIVDQLVDRIEKEVQLEAESICDRTFGGEIPSAGEKQQDKPGVSVQESVNRTGHTDMSDPNDL